MAMAVAMPMTGAMAIQVDMVGSTTQAPEEQPNSHASNQEPAHEPQPILHIPRQAALGRKEQHGGKDEHRTGVGQGRHQAEKKGVADGTPFADEVGRDQGLAVAWGHGVGSAEYRGQEEKNQEPLLRIEQ